MLDISWSFIFLGRIESSVFYMLLNELFLGKKNWSSLRDYKMVIFSYFLAECRFNDEIYEFYCLYISFIYSIKIHFFIEKIYLMTMRFNKHHN